MDQNTQTAGQQPQQHQRQQLVYDPSNNGGHYGIVTLLAGYHRQGQSDLSSFYSVESS